MATLRMRTPENDFANVVRAPDMVAAIIVASDNTVGARPMLGNKLNLVGMNAFMTPYQRQQHGLSQQTLGAGIAPVIAASATQEAKLGLSPHAPGVRAPAPSYPKNQM